LGGAQVLCGVLTVVLSGRRLRVLLWGQFLALCVLPIIVSIQLPDLLFHPFGPISKNLPILAAVYVLARRC
jgi:hypothetical protein